MIDWFQAFALAILQGLTEFLPISSSAHLVIPSLVLGWPDQGLAFDVAVHVGTLSAVLLYYRADLARMATSWFGSLAGQPGNADSRLVWYLALATVPAVLVGFLAGRTDATLAGGGEKKFIPLRNFAKLIRRASRRTSRRDSSRSSTNRGKRRMTPKDVQGPYFLVSATAPEQLKP